MPVSLIYRRFGKSVCEEIVDRAKRPDGKLACEKCGGVLKGRKRGVDYEIDHTIAEHLIPDVNKRDAKGNLIKLTAKDGQLLGKDCCHRPEEGGKTREDVTAIAKAKATAAKDLGLHETKRQMHRGQKPEKPKSTASPSKLAGLQRGEIARRYGTK